MTTMNAIHASLSEILCDLDCGCESDEIRQAARDLVQAAEYLRSKALACEARKAGQIAHAMAVELKCERLYADLPQGMKW